MSNVLQTPNVGSNRGRNSFDMSQRVLFTSSVGQLLPVYYDLLSPGDKVKLSSSIFTRTQELASSAFVRVAEHVDFFFVPYKRIWSNFNSWFAQVNDVTSTRLAPFKGSGQSATYQPFVHPYADFKDIATNASLMDKTSTDVFGVLNYHNTRRLWDLLNYGSAFFDNVFGSQVTATIRFNPSLLYCYHAIYQDFYRIDSREMLPVDASNMDEGSLTLTLDNFRLHYRPWKHDFYTNLYPSQLYAPSNTQSFTSSSGASQVAPTQYLGALQPYLRSETPSGSSLPSPALGSDNGASTVNMTSSNTVPLSNLSLDAIRRAGALEKLAFIQNFTRKFWDNQLATRFGVKIPSTTDHVIYIGSNHSTIEINDVVATATTGGASSESPSSQLGEIAGKGIGFPKQDSVFDFTAPCHGYVMAIYSAEPVADYTSRGLDRLNTYLSLNDFYIPEFDGLGMQPFYAYQGNMTPDTTRNSVPLGWQFRHMELKCKPDIMHGAFNTSLSFWTASRQNQTQSTSVDNFMIDPKYLDTIMLVYFATQPEGETTADWQADAFGRDPLLHSLNIQAYKTSVMSTFSLPNHNAVLL